MKFYRPREMDPNTHPAVRWDKGKDKPMYEFLRGECDIDDDDATLIQRMKRLGFYFKTADGRLVTEAQLRQEDVEEELQGEGDSPAPQPKLQPPFPINRDEAGEIALNEIKPIHRSPKIRRRRDKEE